MHVRPLHDRILVQRLEEGEQHVGGIIIPDPANKKPQRGTIIAAVPPITDRFRGARDVATR